MSGRAAGHPSRRSEVGGRQGPQGYRPLQASATDLKTGDARWGWAPPGFRGRLTTNQRVRAVGKFIEDAIEQTVTAGASGLTYEPVANQYVYVWKTAKTLAGTCQTLQLKLIDGTMHYANFKFRK